MRPAELRRACSGLTAVPAFPGSVFERLPGWASNSYKIDGVGEGERFTHRGYEVELEQIGRDLPVIIAESGVLHRHGEDEIARFFVEAYKGWQGDRRVVAATPLFWDPDVDNHWMFTLDSQGNVATSSPTYRTLRGLPRVAGSPELAPPFGNTPRVSAAAVKSRPLPIFLPDPPSPASSLDASRDAAP